MFRRNQTQEYSGRRQYKQMAVSPEAHARIVEKADKNGISIIDTFDKLMGVK